MGKGRLSVEVSHGPSQIIYTKIRIRLHYRYKYDTNQNKIVTDHFQLEIILHIFQYAIYQLHYVQ